MAGKRVGYQLLAPKKIEVSKLKKIFRHKATGGFTLAIEELTFDIFEGELVAIVGKTGCGKSTLLNMLLGIDRPSDGSITIEGKAPYDNFQYFKGKIATVFQTDRLLPWRTALDNAKIALEILGYGPEDQSRMAGEWLQKLGLKGFEGAYPGELSGGMRQRVGLARAFCIEPDILFCDEAFGHLDEVTAAALRRDFLELLDSVHKTCVFVTHQLDEAIEVAQRILVLGRPGKLLADLRVPKLRKGDLHAVDEIRRQLQHTINENAPRDLSALCSLSQ